MENRLLHVEGGAQIGGAAVAFAGCTRHQRQSSFQRLPFLLGFNDERRVIIEAQDGAVGG